MRVQADHPFTRPASGAAERAARVPNWWSSHLCAWPTDVHDLGAEDRLRSALADLAWSDQGE